MAGWKEDHGIGRWLDRTYFFTLAFDTPPGWLLARGIIIVVYLDWGSKVFDYRF